MKLYKKTILILFLMGLGTNGFSTIIDSVGSIIIEKNRYIIHKVETNETLFSLLKKYNCSATELLEANPSLKGNNQIYVGQLINFPTKKITSNDAYASVSTEKPSDNVKGKHTVAKGETLFSIAKKYNMNVDDLKSLNNISNNSITLGQTLVVSGVENTKQPQKTKSTSTYIPNAPLGKPVREFGIATLIPTSSSNNSYLALHRTAPIGSLIRVTNEMTGNNVTVKVVGRLPMVGADQDVLIKLSPAAYSKLRPKDSKIRTKIDYFLAPEI